MANDDPRGPVRTITAVGEYRQSTTALGGCIPMTLSCGHISEGNFTFSYRVGDPSRCFECGPHGHTVEGMRQRIADARK